MPNDPYMRFRSVFLKMGPDRACPPDAGDSIMYGRRPRG